MIPKDYAGAMALLTVSGSLFVRSDVALEPDAVATVKVVDHDGEVLAATAVEVESLPVDFSVAIDADLVSRDLLVWAFLRNGDTGYGTLELATADAGEIELSRIGD